MLVQAEVQLELQLAVALRRTSNNSVVFRVMSETDNEKGDKTLLKLMAEQDITMRRKVAVGVVN